MADGLDIWMTCADGTRLATRLWSPSRPGPWPVLLMRQPYGRAIASTVTYAHPRWYAERGFLVVVQDVRGCGESQGRFAGFAQEARDGAEAVRWCRRLPGASGRVGTYGFSYQGLSQLLIEAPARAGGETPGGLDPLPDCTAPAMCGVDERLHWAGEGGGHWWDLGLAWGLQLAAAQCRRRGDAVAWREIRVSLDSGRHLDQGLELLERHDPDGMALRWLRSDPGDPQQWRRHPISERLLRRPMLLIGGWHDPQLRGVLDLLQLARAAGGEPLLRIGAWTHLDWRGGIDALQLAFFRRHLLGRGDDPPAAGGPPPGGRWAASAATSGPWPGARLSDDDPGLPPEPAADQGAPAVTATDRAGQERAMAEPGPPPPPLLEAGVLALQDLRQGRWWRRADLAPEARRGWGLGSDGLAAIGSAGGWLRALTDPAAAGGGRVTMVHDPWRPVPSRGGHLGPGPGLVARDDLDRRADVACFSTAPLERALELIGRPRLRLVAWADQPGFDLAVALALVRGDGVCLQLGTGLCRVLGSGGLRRQERRVELQALAVRLEVGERLRLAIAAAAWPAFAVNPGDGSVPRGGSGPEHRVITLELDLDGARLWLDPLIGAN